MDILKYTIDAYFGSVGILALILALIASTYIIYQIIRYRTIKGMILFVLVCLTILYGTKTNVVPVIASLVLIANATFYSIYIIRFLMFRWNRKTIVHDKTPSITVLIPAKDEAFVIEKTLQHLDEVDYDKDKLDIIVIDDASTDATKDICERIARKNENLKLVINRKSLGKSKSLNKTLDTINSEYVMILDADHHVPKEWLKKAITNFTDEKVACVQGKSTIRNGKSNILSRMCEMENMGRYEVLYPGRTMVLFLGSGAIFKTNYLKLVGGFNKDMLTEDIEVTYRLHEMGYKIFFENDIETFDLAPPNIMSYLKQRHRWFRGIWQSFIIHFSVLLRLKNVKPVIKLQFIHVIIENMTLTSLLYMHAMYALDFINLFDFSLKWVIHLKMSVMGIMVFLACLKSKKVKLIPLIPLTNYYFVFYALPNLMAMADNWIIRTKYIWIKTERSSESDNHIVQTKKLVDKQPIG